MPFDVLQYLMPFLDVQTSLCVAFSAGFLYEAYLGMETPRYLKRIPFPSSDYDKHKVDLYTRARKRWYRSRHGVTKGLRVITQLNLQLCKPQKSTWAWQNLESIMYMLYNRQLEEDVSYWSSHFFERPNADEPVIIDIDCMEAVLCKVSDGVDYYYWDHLDVVANALFEIEAAITGQVIVWELKCPLSVFNQLDTSTELVFGRFVPDWNYHDALDDVVDFFISACPPTMTLAFIDSDFSADQYGVAFDNMIAGYEESHAVVNQLEIGALIDTRRDHPYTWGQSAPAIRLSHLRQAFAAYPNVFACLTIMYIHWSLHMSITDVVSLIVDPPSTLLRLTISMPPHLPSHIMTAFTLQRYVARMIAPSPLTHLVLNLTMPVDPDDLPDSTPPWLFALRTSLHMGHVIIENNRLPLEQMTNDANDINVHVFD
jgi:hypothetical protein